MLACIYDVFDQKWSYIMIRSPINKLFLFLNIFTYLSIEAVAFKIDHWLFNNQNIFLIHAAHIEPASPHLNERKLVGILQQDSFVAALKNIDSVALIEDMCFYEGSDPEIQTVVNDLKYDQAHSIEMADYYSFDKKCAGEGDEIFLNELVKKCREAKVQAEGVECRHVFSNWKHDGRSADGDHFPTITFTSDKVIADFDQTIKRLEDDFLYIHKDAVNNNAAKALSEHYAQIIKMAQGQAHPLINFLRTRSKLRFWQAKKEYNELIPDGRVDDKYSWHFVDLTILSKLYKYLKAGTKNIVIATGFDHIHAIELPLQKMGAVKRASSTDKDWSHPQATSEAISININNFIHACLKTDKHSGASNSAASAPMVATTASAASALRAVFSMPLEMRNFNNTYVKYPYNSNNPHSLFAFQLFG